MDVCLSPRLDTSILVRLAEPSSPFYNVTRQAVQTLVQEGSELFLVPQCLVELWVVATRPAGANGFGLTLVVITGTQGRPSYDARLAAAMQASGLSHLLTLNPTDFRRYESVTGLVVVEPRSLPVSISP
jgi:predicted nucleic acid-binding protein